MSETIREVLADEKLAKAILNSTESGERPFYWDSLPTKNGLTAIITAQMIKAMAGDTSAFTALSRFGFGEKVQLETSDFYNARAIDINVINPEALDVEGETPGELGKQAFENATKALEQEIIDGEEAED